MCMVYWPSMMCASISICPPESLGLQACSVPKHFLPIFLLSETLPTCIHVVQKLRLEQVKSSTTTSLELWISSPLYSAFSEEEWNSNSIHYQLAYQGIEGYDGNLTCDQRTFFVSHLQSKRSLELRFKDKYLVNSCNCNSTAVRCPTLNRLILSYELVK